MKKLLIALFLGLSAVAAHAAVISGFNDAYDVANWSIYTNGGSVNTSGAPGSVVLTSSNAGNGYTYQDFTIAAAAGGEVSFDWNYITYDWGPSYDPFGFLLNGSFFQLSSDWGSSSQGGTATFLVSAGDVFGFRAIATDSVFGPSVTTISNFSANAVPEPESLALLGLGLIALFIGSKRKRTA